MAESKAYFQVEDASGSKPPFIIELTKPALIKHARAVLTGEETEEVHIQGTIEKSIVPYNEDWSYHVDPNTVSFFSNAIEVCDATIVYVEENLDDIGGSTLPGRHWCPWTSKLVRELPADQFSLLLDVPLGPETFEDVKTLVQRFDPADLNPDFATALEQLITKCADRGAKMVPYMGLRTPWAQAKLWRRSRSTATVRARIAKLRADGADFLAQVIEDIGPQPTAPNVTNAIPGYSWHQWGEAADSYWEVDGKANWSATEIHNGVNGYQVYAEEATNMGMVAGGYWSIQDWPHVHFPKVDSPSDQYSLLEINAEMKTRFEQALIA